MIASNGACRPLLYAAAAGLALAATTPAAFAWGDEGHEAVALIAEHFLTPEVRASVHTLIAADADTLTPHDIAAEAIWADRYKHAGGRSKIVANRPTGKWHYVNIELDDPDIDRACYGHPGLRPGATALDGPANDCITDKIDQFAAELSSPATSAAERLIALKFLLHLVGDLHQPLHACDNHDAGGNLVRVRSAAARAGSLHGYWDSVFIARLGNRPRVVANALIAKVTPKQRAEWQKGTPEDWAMESFRFGRDEAYGKLGRARADKPIFLSQIYVNGAVSVVRLQVSRAGLRLAAILNRALAPGSG